MLLFEDLDLLLDEVAIEKIDDNNNSVSNIFPMMIVILVSFFFFLMWLHLMLYISM
jgi:hypothetical protein